MTLTDSKPRILDTNYSMYEGDQIYLAWLYFQLKYDQRSQLSSLESAVFFFSSQKLAFFSPLSFDFLRFSEIEIKIQIQPETNRYASICVLLSVNGLLNYLRKKVVAQLLFQGIIRRIL